MRIWVVQNRSFKPQQRVGGHIYIYIYPHVHCCVHDSAHVFQSQDGYAFRSQEKAELLMSIYKPRQPDTGKQSYSISLFHVNISTLGYTVALGPQEELFVQITRQINGMCIPRTHNSGRKKKNKIIKLLKGTCLGWQFPCHISALCLQLFRLSKINHCLFFLLFFPLNNGGSVISSFVLTFFFF